MLQPEQQLDSNLTVVGCKEQNGGARLCQLPLGLHMETNRQNRKFSRQKLSDSD